MMTLVEKAYLRRCVRRLPIGTKIRTTGEVQPCMKVFLDAIPTSGTVIGVEYSTVYEDVIVFFKVMIRLRGGRL